MLYDKQQILPVPEKIVQASSSVKFETFISRADELQASNDHGLGPAADEYESKCCVPVSDRMTADNDSDMSLVLPMIPYSKKLNCEKPVSKELISNSEPETNEMPGMGQKPKTRMIQFVWFHNY